MSEQIARNLNYQPIQERAAEVQREKQVRLARIKYEADLENVDLTFQPQISDISQKLARKKVLRKGDPEALDVTNRLLKDAEDLKLQKKIREKQLLTEQQLQCKFQPTVSSKSKQLLQNNPLFQKEFVERQKVLSKARRRCASDEEQKNFTFKPNIGKSYNRVLKPARLLESEAERYQRLAHTERYVFTLTMPEHATAYSTPGGSKKIFAEASASSTMPNSLINQKLTPSAELLLEKDLEWRSSTKTRKCAFHASLRSSRQKRLKQQSVRSSQRPTILRSRIANLCLLMPRISSTISKDGGKSENGC